MKNLRILLSFALCLTWMIGMISCGGSDSDETSYSQDDLTGTWEINSLASGPGAPWWERGPITISSDGSFSGTVTYNDGNTGNPSGTFNISTDGIITLTGSSDFKGCMDSGKTVIVCTDIWDTGSPGTTEIKVLTRK